MFNQESSARTRSRLATALVALALTAAVLVVVSQASSIGSTNIGEQVQSVPAQNDLTAIRRLQTSIHIPKGCTRRKFGCGQDATTTVNPDLQTSIHIPKGCTRRKFGCGQDATTTVNRP
jgi:hypothetical protein